MVLIISVVVLIIILVLLALIKNIFVFLPFISEQDKHSKLKNPK